MSRNRRQQRKRMRRHVHLLLVQCPSCHIYRAQGPRCPVPFCELGRPTAKDRERQAKRNGRIFRRLKRERDARVAMGLT